MYVIFNKKTLVNIFKIIVKEKENNIYKKYTKKRTAKL